MTRNAALAMIAALVVIAAGYGLQLGLGRAVTPEEFAFLQETLAFYMMTMLPLQPIGAVVTKQAARHEDRLWNRLTHPAAIASVLVSTALVYGFSGARDAADWTPSTAAIFALSVITGIGFLITNSIAIGRLDFAGSTFIQSVQAVIRVALALPLVWSGAGAQGLWCATAFANGSAALCARWRFSGRGRAPVSEEAVPAHQKRDFAIAVCCYAAIGLLTQLDLIYAHRSFPDAPTYAGAALFGKLVFYFPAAASTIALPLLARAEPGAASDRILHRAFLVVGAVAGLCFVGIAALGPAVAGRVLGPAYAQSGPYVVMSAAAMLPYSIVNLYASASLAAGRLRLAIFAAAAAAAVVLAAATVHLPLASLCWLIGGTGVVLAVVGELDVRRQPSPRMARGT